jgi:hypothetical protein
MNTMKMAAKVMTRFFIGFFSMAECLTLLAHIDGGRCATAGRPHAPRKFY